MMNFRKNEQYMNWLNSTVIKTIEIFEKQFNVITEKFEDQLYKNKHPKEAYILNLLYRVVRDIEVYKSNNHLINMFDDKKIGSEIFKVEAIQYFTKEIIKISEYKKVTKDTKRPDSPEHTKTKEYLLSSNLNVWNDEEFQKLLRKYIEESEIIYQANKTTPDKSNKKVDQFLAVKESINSGENKTNALVIVSKKLNKADIRTEYNKIEKSNFAKGAGRIIAKVNSSKN